jgi:hypothetical protein
MFLNFFLRAATILLIIAGEDGERAAEIAMRFLALGARASDWSSNAALPQWRCSSNRAAVQEKVCTLFRPRGIFP